MFKSRNTPLSLISFETLHNNEPYSKSEELQCCNQHSDLLLAHIEELWPFILPEYKEKISQCSICITGNSDGAVSFLENNQRFICFGQKFINLVVNTILNTSIGSVLPNSFDKELSCLFDVELPLSHIYSNALFLMTHYHLKHDQPLPNLIQTLPDYLIREHLPAIKGALMFTLLHEFAHHELGHFDPANIDIIEQDVTQNHEKIMEIEADIFAFDCIQPDARIIGMFWIEHVLAYFVQEELIIGNNVQSGHPIALNRAINGKSLVHALGMRWNLNQRALHYSQLVQRFKMKNPAVTRELSAISYDTCYEAIYEINQKIKSMGGMNLDTILTPSPDWLSTHSHIN